MKDLSLLNELKSKRLFLFGAGKIGNAVLSYLTAKEVSVAGFLDHDQKKQESGFHSLPVYNPNELVNFSASEKPIAILITIMDYLEAYEEIFSLMPAFPKENIYVGLSWKIPYEDDQSQIDFSNQFFRGRAFSDYSEEEISSLLADDASRSLFHFIHTIRGGHVNLFRFADLSRIDGNSQYFHTLSTLPEFSPNGRHAVIIDCGAYTGDSILELLSPISPHTCSYFAFEPDCNVLPLLEKSEQRINLSRTAQKKPLIHFTNISAGVWAKEADFSFHLYTDHASSSLLENHNLAKKDDGSIHVLPLDSLSLPEGKIYLKMDVEGSELAALSGASRLIQSRKPVLAICAYHRPSDLFTIPLMLSSLNPTYRIYLAGGMHYTYYAI